MEPLPADKIVAALPRACATAVASGWGTAVRAIMTTDTVPKAASRRINVDGAADDPPVAVATRPFQRAAQKVGRNDPCPCGSGKKYKHCHGRL